MTYFVSTDETGRIGATTQFEEYAAGMSEFDFPEDFDFATQHEYRIVDGELVHDPLQPTEEELAAQEEAERQSQIRAAVPMLMNAMASTLTDAQILTAPLLFDKWDDGIDYKEGDVRRYGDGIYRCKKDNTSQKGWEPYVSTASLWTAITPEGAQPWQPNQSYDQGATVTHNGKTWESLVPNNVWEPGSTGTETVWKEVS